MDAALAKRIERILDRVAALSLAGSCAYAAYPLLGAWSAEPGLTAQAGGVAAFAYLFGMRALAAIDPEPQRVPVAIFDVRQIDPEPLPELLLTEVHEPASAAEPLMLDDVLGELAPDSRVVRLFDPAAMPTAGQLNKRIESHLSASNRRDAPNDPDAAQALHDALAQLRRSLG